MCWRVPSSNRVCVRVFLLYKWAVLSEGMWLSMYVCACCGASCNPFTLLLLCKCLLLVISHSFRGTQMENRCI